MTTGRVAVIGARVAGLTAARNLAHVGWEVVVLEKARGVGGRTSRRRSEAAAFDHGARIWMPRFSRALELDFGGALVSESPLAWVARNASEPGRPGAKCCVFHANPEWSAHHLEQLCEAVAESLLGDLGDAVGRELPAESSFAVHCLGFARTTQPVGTPLL